MAKLQEIVSPAEQAQQNEAKVKATLLGSAIQAGLSSGKKSSKGTFATSTTGLFGQAREETGIPAFGGIFGITGRQARKRVEGNITNFNDILEASGIVPDEEMTKDIRTAFESGMGAGGAAAIVDARIQNSPEAVAGREEVARREKKTFDDNVRAAADTHTEAVRQLKEDQVFMGVESGLVREDRKTVSKYQGAVDDVADMMALNEKFGPIRGPAWTEGDRARAKQAYESLTQRLTSTFQKLFEAEAMSDRELEFIQGQIPDFDTWADMTNSQRQVAMSEMDHWITREATDTIQSNRALREGSKPATFRPGQSRGIDEILAQPLPPTLTEIEIAEAAQLQAEQAERAAAFVEPESTPTQKLIPGLKPEPPGAIEQAKRGLLQGAGTGIGEIINPPEPEVVEEEEQQGPVL